MKLLKELPHSSRSNDKQHYLSRSKNTVETVAQVIVYFSKCTANITTNLYRGLISERAHSELDCVRRCAPPVSWWESRYTHSSDTSGTHE